MATLYELTSNYRKLQSLANETDPEVFNDTMASIDDAIQDKAIGYAKVISSMEAETVEIQEQISRLQARKKNVTTNIDRMKNNLIQAFHTADINQVKDPLFTVKLSAGRESVVIRDEKQLPVDAFEPQPAKPSKTKIKALLQKGREVNGAELVRNETLSIK